MSDHADHIHVGYRPIDADTKSGSVKNAVLKPGQWYKVIDRLGEIENPVVRTKPSKVAIKVTPRKRVKRSRTRSQPTIMTGSAGPARPGTPRSRRPP